VILPDSTILIDYMQHLAIGLVGGLVIDAERMRANLELTHGALFSQRVLLRSSRRPASRDEAYRVTQELAQRAWTEQTPLRDLLAADPRTSGLDLDAIFAYEAFTRHVPELIARLDEL
jgi:adenylosuccinate lyase